MAQLDTRSRPSLTVNKLHPALGAEVLGLSMERDTLEAELTRTLSHGQPRTVQGRRRKAEVENRLDELKRQIGKINLDLRGRPM